MKEGFEEFPHACPSCGEENPAGFPACWNCHADLVAVAWGSAPGDDAPPPEPTPSARGGRRPAWLAFELIAVLLALWLPDVVGSWQARTALSYELEPVGALEEPAEPGGALFEDEIYYLASNVGLIALVLFLVWRAGDWKRISGLGRPRALPLLIWTVVLWCVWFFASNAMSTLREGLTGPLPGPVDWGRSMPDSVLAASLVPLFTFVAAAFEEVFFRAYLWHRLTLATRSPVAALLIASAMFAAVHPYDMWDCTTLFVQALVFGLVFWVERSLWPLILAHTLYNLTIPDTWYVI